MGSSSSKMDEHLRENKRRVGRTIRELERQKMSAERQEQSLVSRLKSEARMGKEAGVRTVAKDILRSRRMANHFSNMRSQMMALQSQLQAAQSSNMLSRNFKEVSDLMTQVNSSTDVAEFQKIMNNISRQGEMLNLKLDMVEEAMADSFMDVDGSLNEERAIRDLLNELGVEVGVGGACGTAFGEVPSASNTAVDEFSKENASSRREEMLELEERINNLKKTIQSDSVENADSLALSRKLGSASCLPHH